MRLARPVFLLFFAAACGGGGSGSGGDACEPGARTSCACGDAAGTMVCDEGGGWGACSCTGAVEWSPATLDFGETDTTAPREVALTLWRNADAPTPIRSVRLVDADPAFTLVSAPEVIPAGGEAVLVVVAFQADLPLDARGTLVVELDDAGPPITVRLRAGRVGLAVTCAAADLDFGQQTLGVPATRHVTCRNVSVLDSAGSGTVVLRPQGVASDDPEFGGSVSGELFGPGEEFTFDVSYLPLDAEPDRATVRLVTAQGLELSWEASGSSELATCHLEVSVPLALTGVPGEELAGVVEVRNTSDEAGCRIARVEADPNCDAEFSFEWPAPGTTVLPGAALPVPFRFRGHEQRSFACTLRAVADDPEAHEWSVDLAAVLSWRPCLVAEGPTEFPIVSPTCGGVATIDLALRNLCRRDFPVDGLRFAEGAAPWFSVESGAFPATIAPGGTLEVTLVSDPNLDASWGETQTPTLEVLSPLDAEPWRFTFRGYRGGDPTDVRVWTQPYPWPLDVLVVIDNGVGMAAEQAGLLAALGPMPERLAGRDYRLAVTTTGLVPAADGTCPGGVSGGEDGRLFPVDGSRPRVVGPSTPNARSVWESNLQVGTCHDQPARPFAAALRALSSPLASVGDDSAHPEPDDGNGGLLRSDESLLLLFVGDRDDSSSGLPTDNWFRLSYTRPFGKLEVVTIAGDPSVGCTGPQGESAAPGQRLHELAVVAGGREVSICSIPGDLLDRYAFELPRCFPIDVEPADGSGNGVIDEADLLVRVHYVPQAPVLPDGRVVWTWDAEARQVCFAPDAVPPSGEYLSVRWIDCAR